MTIRQYIKQSPPLVVGIAGVAVALLISEPFGCGMIGYSVGFHACRYHEQFNAFVGGLFRRRA